MMSIAEKTTHQNKASTFTLPPQTSFSYAESVILGHIRKNQALTKVDIIGLTDFSRSKVTGCINALVKKGYLTENGFGENTGGRRSVLFQMNGGKGILLGADIGATSIDLIITDLKGKTLARYSEPAMVKDGPNMILDRIIDLFEEMTIDSGLSNKPVLAFGMGVPGPVNFNMGMVVSPPIMPGWDQFPIVPHVKKRLPDTLVVVDNDVNIMALGECVQGVATGKKNLIFVKIGTGIGAGIICDEKIYHGASGCAGDIGHICVDKDGPVCPCGNRGCLEVLAGGDAIAERAIVAVKDRRSKILKKYYDLNAGVLTAKDVGNAAKEGDEVSIGIIRDSGQKIGEVLASLVNFYNPGMIVIGGGVSKLGNLLLSSIRQAILKRSLPLATKELPIVYSSILEDAGVIGATSLALESFITASVNE